MNARSAKDFISPKVFESRFDFRPRQHSAQSMLRQDSPPQCRACFLQLFDFGFHDELDSLDALVCDCAVDDDDDDELELVADAAVELDEELEVAEASVELDELVTDAAVLDDELELSSFGFRENFLKHLSPSNTSMVEKSAWLFRCLFD
jgi:hypothetical protein